MVIFIQFLNNMYLEWLSDAGKDNLGGHCSFRADESANQARRESLASDMHCTGRHAMLLSVLVGTVRQHSGLSL